MDLNPASLLRGRYVLLCPERVPPALPPRCSLGLGLETGLAHSLFAIVAQVSYNFQLSTHPEGTAYSWAPPQPACSPAELISVHSGPPSACRAAGQRSSSLCSPPPCLHSVSQSGWLYLPSASRIRPPLILSAATALSHAVISRTCLCDSPQLGPCTLRDLPGSQWLSRPFTLCQIMSPLHPCSEPSSGLSSCRGKAIVLTRPLPNTGPVHSVTPPPATLPALLTALNPN